MKTIKISLKALLILTSVFFLNFSAHKSIWPNSDFLTNESKSNCVQFQFLKGSNRTAEFKKIAIETLELKNIEENKTYSTNKFDLKDLKKIFGEPDIVISETQFIYNLNPNNSNSLVEFKFNKSNNSLELGIKQCS